MSAICDSILEHLKTQPWSNSYELAELIFGKQDTISARQVARRLSDLRKAGKVVVAKINLAAGYPVGDQLRSACHVWALTGQSYTGSRGVQLERAP